MTTLYTIRMILNGEQFAVTRQAQDVRHLGRVIRAEFGRVQMVSVCAI